MATNEPTEQVVISPVPGLSNELAALLIGAIKTRRKYLSKSSSSSGANRSTPSQISLEDSAIDACTAFLGGLRKQVEASKSRQNNSSDAALNSKRIQNAASRSLEFLLSTLSESDNSFHLRRAALILCKEILIRSSDGRAYLDGESILMDFVSMIRQAEQQDGPNSTAKIFQQEAIELIALLANKYGQLYPKFVVAERLLAEISTVSSTSHNSTSHSNVATMKSLRAERDVALQKGCKACDVVERILERADGYFGILVPRFGGFTSSKVADSVIDGHEADAQLKSEEEEAYNEAVTQDRNDRHNVEAIEDEDDDIDWEEGDDHVSESENPEYDPSTEANPAENDSSIPDWTTDHNTAVAQTLAVMQRSGVLQEGGLSVEVGSTQMTTASDTDNIHQKLKKLVEDLAMRRLPRLNRWIHALSHADGMEERVVADPASSSAGPVSLVLLSEEKRAARGPLLKRMMKVKGEIGLVLQSASAIGALADEQPIEAAAPSSNAEGVANAKKRSWLSSVVVAGNPLSATKKSKSTKFKVIYRKK